ncbi:unnamed protein product [Amoebophrya sp. A25]|nr:unnamed protein product [Amoebophrya sp. A25]|eukprot:GSA25T00021444001.1
MAEANKVFVGGLPLEATVEILREYAAPFGEVKDAVVMQDKLTKRSRGFGFITFIETESAQKCLATPGHSIMGKPVDIKPTESPEDPDPEWKLFCGGLEDSVRDEGLRNKFMEFGEPASAVVMMRDGASRRFGFVTFKSEEEFRAAIMCPSVEINGKVVDVKVAQLPKGHYFPTEGKLYIGELGETINQAMLHEHFAQFGEILHTTVMMDAATQKSKGFGFVQMKDPKLAYDLLKKEHNINEIAVVVKCSANNAPAGSKGKGDEKGKKGFAFGGKGGFYGYQAPGQGGKGGGFQDVTNKIFVGGLPQSANNDSLRQFFGQYGAIKDAIAMYDRETGKPRGFGYVTFMSEQDMYTCIGDKQNHYIDQKYIDVKKADNRSPGGGGAGYGFAAPQAAYGYGQAPAYGFGGEYAAYAVDPNYAYAAAAYPQQPFGAYAAYPAQQYYAVPAAGQVRPTSCLCRCSC